VAALVNTFLEPPDDICALADAPQVGDLSYLVNPRSIVALARIAEGDTVSSRTESDSQH
jgi:hypothetical protein